jgi:hypothetical protein
MKIRPVGADCSMTETEEHDEANSRFSQFCVYAYKWISNFQPAT